jgi:hypothetical protein
MARRLRARKGCCSNLRRRERHRRRKVAAKLGEGKTVVTMLCDTGERYLSVNL